MKVEKIVCDCCGEEIPTVKKKDIFGIEREIYRFGKISFGEPFENIDVRYLVGLDLCEKCAGVISLKILKKRIEVLSREGLDKTQMEKYLQKGNKNG